MDDSEIEKQRRVYKLGLIFFAVVVAGAFLSFLFPKSHNTATEILSVIIFGAIMAIVVIGISRLSNRVTIRVLQRTLALILSILFAVLTYFFATELGTTSPDHQLIVMCTSLCAVFAVMLFALALGAPVDEFRQKVRNRIDQRLRNLRKK